MHNLLSHKLKKNLQKNSCARTKKTKEFSYIYWSNRLKQVKDKHMNTTTETLVKAYTLKELSALYGISPKTFKNWLQPYVETIGEKRGWYFNTLQVKLIFEKLGQP